jgi:hypothetical protein
MCELRMFGCRNASVQGVHRGTELVQQQGLGVYPQPGKYLAVKDAGGGVELGILPITPLRR